MEENGNTVHIPQSAVERSPRTHVDSQPLPTDSMVTVPLSESDGGQLADQEEDVTDTVPSPTITVEEQRVSPRPTSAEIMQAFGRQNSQDGSVHTPPMNSPTISLPEDDSPQTPTRSADRSRSGSNGSDRSEHVDWAELEKSEEKEPQQQGQDEVGFRRRSNRFGY